MTSPTWPRSDCCPHRSCHARCWPTWRGPGRAVEAALALLYARERNHVVGYAEVSFADAARLFADPLRHGLTRPGGALNGRLPAYNLYRAREGWIALAALEPHFRERLQGELGLERIDREELERVFTTASATYWEAWPPRATCRWRRCVISRLSTIDEEDHRWTA